MRRQESFVRAIHGKSQALVILLGLACGWAGAVVARVEIVLGDSAPAYLEARAELAAQLAGIELVVSAATSLASAAKRANLPEVVLALGSEALRTASRMREDAPIVTLLIPRESFERLRDEARATGHHRPVTGVYLDQPWSRQIALVRLIAPERRRIGVLSTSSFVPQVSVLERIAKEQKATIIHELVESPQALHVDLMRIIGGADVLLAVPDARVYSASTIQHILLTTFRARLPLIGFSPAYVQAGALAAVYSTPTQMAREAAAMVRRLLAGQAPPGGEYPRAFTVTVNRAVARSLDLAVDEDAALVTQLEQRERER